MAVYYNEIDPFCAEWLRNLIAAEHIPAGDVDERSIVEVQPDDLRPYVQAHFFAGLGGWPYALQLAGWGDRAVWTGSCPCQPVSSAGQRKGHADERHLWPAFHRLIAECKPAVLFGEQVASRDGREWFAAVRADLEHVGYAVGGADLPVAGLGAPHIRQRLFFVADAEHAERRTFGGDRENGCDRQNDGRPETHGIAGTCGEVRRLADADGGDAGPEGLQRGGEHRQRAQDGGAGGVGNASASRLPPLECDGLEGSGRRQEGRAASERSRAPGGLADTVLVRADAGQEPPEKHQGSGGSGRRDGAELGDDSSYVRSRPLDGFWRDADWLLCRDGKWRPVSPGSFPLASGVPARVGKLRAAGNSICPQVGAAFVRAAMDIPSAAWLKRAGSA